MRKWIAALATLALCAGAVSSAAMAQAKDLNGFGIVLMHGKGGRPEGLTASLDKALKDQGALVTSPVMPWHGTQGRPEGYLESYDEAMQKIERAIADLKSRGAAKIVVGGQSFGANAALRYAVRGGKDLAGIIVLAPGHRPENPYLAAALAGDVQKARDLIKAGRGDAVITLHDFNQGDTFSVKAKPAAYLSYFDPKGSAVMPTNAAAMPPIPLLWVIGRRDPLFPQGEGYAYARAPKNARSKYVVVNADHRTTPDVARGDVIAWLKTL